MHGQLKRLTIGILGALLLIPLGGCSYNKFVGQEEAIKSQWAQVENQLQRRNDLIPNLVETVKGTAAQEQTVFKAIADSRAKLAGATTPERRCRRPTSRRTALSRLLVIVENYPQLKSNDSFNRLMDELSGTENRIAVERMRYNEGCRPTTRRAGSSPPTSRPEIFGFKEYEFFEAPPEAKETPKVAFPGRRSRDRPLAPRAGACWLSRRRPGCPRRSSIAWARARARASRCLVLAGVGRPDRPGAAVVLLGRRWPSACSSCRRQRVDLPACCWRRWSGWRSWRSPFFRCRRRLRVLDALAGPGRWWVWAVAGGQVLWLVGTLRVMAPPCARAWPAPTHAAGSRLRRQRRHLRGCRLAALSRAGSTLAATSRTISSSRRACSPITTLRSRTTTPAATTARTTRRR